MRLFHATGILLTIFFPIVCQAEMFVSGSFIAPRRTVTLRHSYAVLAEWNIQTEGEMTDMRDVIILVEAKKQAPDFAWQLRNPVRGSTIDAVVLPLDDKSVALHLTDILFTEGHSKMVLRALRNTPTHERDQLRFTLCAPQHGEQQIACAAALKAASVKTDHKIRVSPEDLTSGDEVPYVGTPSITRWMTVR